MTAKYKLELSRDTGIPCMVMEKEYPGSRGHCPDEILELLENQEHLSHLAEEHIYLVCLDTKLSVRAVFEVAHGTVDAAQADMKSFMIRILLSGAAGFVVVHNHPSGDVTPSRQDHMITQKIQEAARLLDVNFLDHLIAGTGGRYFSFKENGNPGKA